MPDKKVMPLIDKQEGLSYEPGSIMSLVREGFEAGAREQRDADQKWSDDRLEKQAESDDYPDYKPEAKPETLEMIANIIREGRNKSASGVAESILQAIHDAGYVKLDKDQKKKWAKKCEDCDTPLLREGELYQKLDIAKKEWAKNEADFWSEWLAHSVLEYPNGELWLEVARLRIAELLDKQAIKDKGVME